MTTATIDWELVYSDSANTFAAQHEDFCVLDNGDVLATINHAGTNPRCDILVSQNNGTTWSIRATITFGTNEESEGLISYPGGKVTLLSTALFLFGTPPGGGRVNIRQSTDYGATWSIVKTYGPFQDNAGASPIGYARSSYNKTSATIGGRLVRVGGFLEPQIVRSTDSGATWSGQIAVGSRTTDNLIRSIINLSGGKFLAGAQSANVYGSTDHGGSWALAGTLPLGSGATLSACDFFAALTATDIIAGGVISPTINDGRPGLWTSSNAGTTWTRIPSSAIEHWPSITAVTTTKGINRLTKTCAIMGLGSVGPSANSPWKITNDSGATWTDTGTVTGLTFGTNDFHAGYFITTPGGKILAHASSGGAVRIFQGTPRC